MNPIFLLLAASGVETVAAFVNGIFPYALSVGIVSLMLSVTLLILQSKNPDALLKVLFSLPKVGEVSVELLIAFALFAWWAVAAGILTFQGPFNLTQNGFFATWAALAASTLIASTVIPEIQDATLKAKRLSIHGTPIVLLLLCALVVLFAALQNTNGWEPMLMIAFAAITIVYCFLLLLSADTLSEQMKQTAAAIVLIIWLIEAGIGTFRGPFTITSNGYFASWIGLLAAIHTIAPNLPDALQAKNARESVIRSSEVTIENMEKGGPAPNPPPSVPPPSAPEPAPPAPNPFG